MIICPKFAFFFLLLLISLRKFILELEVLIGKAWLNPSNHCHLSVLGILIYFAVQFQLRFLCFCILVLFGSLLSPFSRGWVVLVYTVFI